MRSPGLARLGFIAEFLAKPVLAGYMVGLALVILVGQLSSLLGIPAGSGNFFQLAWNVLTNLGSVSGWTVAVRPRLARADPRPAGRRAAAAGVADRGRCRGHRRPRVRRSTSHGVAELGTITAAMPEVSVPSISFADVERLFAGAVGLSLLAYAESIAAARSFAAKHRYEVDANQELIALGATNIGSGLLQGFAIDASVSRTSVADGAGQRSQLAGLVNLVLVVVTLALLTPFFADLPKATLAAVVIAAVLPLLKTAGLRRLYRIDKADFAVALVCLVGVLVAGVLDGIVVAVVASLVALVYRSFRPEVAVLGRSRCAGDGRGHRLPRRLPPPRGRDVPRPGHLPLRPGDLLRQRHLLPRPDPTPRRFEQPATARDPRRRRPRSPTSTRPASTCSPTCTTNSHPSGSA